MNRRGGGRNNVTYKCILLLAIAIVVMFQFVLFTTTATMNDMMSLLPPLADMDADANSSGIGNIRRLDDNNNNEEETKKKEEEITTTCSVSNLLQESASSSSTTTSQQQQQQQQQQQYYQPMQILQNLLRRIRLYLFPIKKKPCAILFFGLAKQFRSITLPSIQQHILLHNVQCDIYAHTYDVTTVTGKSHKNETGIIINPKEIYDLTSNVILDTNEEFELKRNMRRLLNGIYKPTRRMGWSKESLGNMYRQWHSIERVWDYMEETENKLGIQYERVGLFRSDVKYETPINIFDDEGDGDGHDAVIPKFGFLVNDRMFYGLRQYAHIWSKIRFSGMKRGCYKPRHPAIGMHSEFYMKDFILTKIPTNVVEDNKICFYRVRGSGEISYDDCTKKYDFPPFLIEAGLIKSEEIERV